MTTLTSEQAREMRARPGSGANAGRRRRAEEQEIKDALGNTKPLGDVLTKLSEAVERRESWAISLWLAYMWGKPADKVEVSGPSSGPVVFEVVYDQPGAQIQDSPAGHIQAPQTEGIH